MLMYALACLTLSTALAAAQDVQPTPPAPLPARIEARIEASPPTEVLMVHDVQDLTGQGELDALARDIVSDKVLMETRVASLDKYRALIEAGDPRSKMRNIVETIKALIQPPLTGEQQKIETINDGALLLFGTPDQHQWILDYLRSMRTYEGFLDIKATVLLLPTDRFEKVMGGRTGRVIDAAELELLHKLAAGGDAERVSAPRLVVRPSHLASIANVEQTAYIKDYSLTVMGEREIVDPEIAVLETGLTLAVRAATLGPERCALHAELTLSSAERPFREHKLRLGSSGTEVTVQLPEVGTLRVSGRFDLTAGHAVVIGGLDPDGAKVGGGLGFGERKDGQVLVLLEVRRVARGDSEPR